MGVARDLAVGVREQRAGQRHVEISDEPQILNLRLIGFGVGAGTSSIAETAIVFV
jgi:hypothetical protein